MYFNLKHCYYQKFNQNINFIYHYHFIMLQIKLFIIQNYFIIIYYYHYHLFFIIMYLIKLCLMKLIILMSQFILKFLCYQVIYFNFYQYLFILKYYFKMITVNFYFNINFKIILNYFMFENGSIYTFLKNIINSNKYITFLYK